MSLLRYAKYTRISLSCPPGELGQARQVLLLPGTSAAITRAYCFTSSPIPVAALEQAREIGLQARLCLSWPQT
jgi:hypothetical protein